MDNRLNGSALTAFYKEHLTESLLPFWEKAVDREHGGIFTCYSNDGERLFSRDKYTWSQGRFVWLWSKLAGMSARGLLPLPSGRYAEEAGKAADFLRRNAIMDNGNCAFLLTEDGRMKESEPGKGFDTSVYADCFVVLGFAAYARVSGDSSYVEAALRLYDRIVERVEEGSFRSEPYPIAPGYRAHAIPMILLNVTQELLECAEAFGHARCLELADRCRRFMDDIMNRFLQPDGRIAEIVPASGAAPPDTVLCRHVNPGHTLECMWFVMHAAVRLEREELLAPAGRAVKRAFELGWDADYGGLLRFVDRDGGRPAGRLANDPYETLVLDTWDTKLWWPHSEALYVTLLSSRLLGDPDFAALYDKTHRYVFRTFPNPDRTIGEWVQIRDRQGRPLDKIVALPVKDPFHIMRNVLLIIELLDGDGQRLREVASS